MKATDLERTFDAGKSISAQLDTTKSRRVNQETRRVNVDFPGWMIESLDREARRLGITRQAIIKVWIARMLEQQTS